MVVMSCYHVGKKRVHILDVLVISKVVILYKNKPLFINGYGIKDILLHILYVHHVKSLIIIGSKNMYKDQKKIVLTGFVDIHHCWILTRACVTLAFQTTFLCHVYYCLLNVEVLFEN